MTPGRGTRPSSASAASRARPDLDGLGWTPWRRGRPDRPDHGPRHSPDPGNPGPHDPGPHDPGADNSEEGWDNRNDWPAMDAWILGQQTGTGDTGRAADAGTGNGTDGSAGADGPGSGGSGSSDDGEDDADDSGGSGTRPPPRPGGLRGPGGHGRNVKQAGKRRGKRVAAWINLTMPLKTLLELGTAPGDAGPFGPLDPAAARDLARTATAHPGTRWCLTLTDPKAGRRPRLRPRPPALGRQAPTAGPGNRDGPPDSDPDPRTVITRFLARLGITLEPIATTCCDHHDAEPGYIPQPVAPPQNPRPHSHLLLLGLPQTRRPMRRRPHPRLAARRPDLPVQPGATLPKAPPDETAPRLAAGPAGTRCAGLADTRRTHLYHHPRPIHQLGRRGTWSRKSLFSYATSAPAVAHPASQLHGEERRACALGTGLGPGAREAWGHGCASRWSGTVRRRSGRRTTTSSPIPARARRRSPEPRWPGPTCYSTGWCPAA